MVILVNGVELNPVNNVILLGSSIVMLVSPEPSKPASCVTDVGIVISVNNVQLLKLPPSI